MCGKCKGGYESVPETSVYGSGVSETRLVKYGEMPKGRYSKY